MIKDAIKSLFIKGSFTQDVAIVGIGKVFIAIIGFAFIPFLARIYSPEAYGIFSYYNSSISILLPVISLSFPSALIIAKSEKSFYNLAFLSSCLVIFSTLLILGILSLFKETLLQIITIEFNYKYLFFIPAGILINGFLQIFVNWNVRRKRFKYATTVAVSHQLFIRIFNVIYGIMIKMNNFGLIIGNQSGRLIAIIIHFNTNFLRERKHFISFISKKNLRKVWIEFKSYPKFILPTNLILTLRNSVIIFFIGFGFGENALGNFTMTVTLLSIPIQILGNSVSSVFIKKASDIFRNNRSEITPFVTTVVNKLLLLGFLPFLIISVFGKEIFVILLGNKWEMAGIYTSFLGPYYLLYLIFFPVFSLYQIYKKEKLLFIINFLSLIFILLSLIIGIYLNDSLKMIILFSIASMISYAIQALIIFHMAGIEYRKLIIKVLGSLVIISVFIYIKLIFTT